MPPRGSETGARAGHAGPAAPALAIHANFKVIVGLAIAAVIAWLAPFDLEFDKLTFGVPAVRVVAILVLATAGVWLGRALGFSLEPPARDRALTVPVLCAIVVAVGCAIVDHIFRHLINGNLVSSIVNTPVVVRVALYSMRAFNENIIYRLFFGPLIIWLITLFWRTKSGKPTDGAIWFGFGLAQFINIWINVISQSSISWSSVIYDVLRYVTPAMVWAWLYWRRGFLSCEVACTSVHVFLQPLMIAAVR